MIYKKDPIQVAFACDRNYVMPLTVALCSAAANCDRARSLVFNIFQNGISPSVREKVEGSLRRIEFPDAYINWLEAPIEHVASFKMVKEWLTPSAFVRLLIPDLLPIDIEKVLYLDCDIVVNDDLGELWDMDMDNKSLLAARDTIGWVGNPNGGLSNYRELGIPGDAKYFNSGVLVINARKWREHATSQRLLNYLRNNQEIIKYEDQEVLNAVLFDDWGELEFRWNWQIIWRGVRIGTHTMDWTPERKRKSIIHFITGEKPWLPGCDYEERRHFFEYLDRTEWAGWRVPWMKEIQCRSIRPFHDARNAAGRLRQRLRRNSPGYTDEHRSLP